MKTIQTIVKTRAGRTGILLGTLAVTGLIVSLVAQPKTSSPTKDFMRQKLEHSQRVLEGITTEQFDLVAKHAQKLGVLTQEASWRAFDNPEYARHSDSFRRHTQALAKAAADRNLDGATLAYVKLTMSCVECHKFIRGRNAAQTEQKGSRLGVRIRREAFFINGPFRSEVQHE